MSFPDCQKIESAAESPPLQSSGPAFGCVKPLWFENVEAKNLVGRMPRFISSRTKTLPELTAPQPSKKFTRRASIWMTAKDKSSSQYSGLPRADAPAPGSSSPLKLAARNFGLQLKRSLSTPRNQSPR